jgi:hypothetical protein
LFSDPVFRSGIAPYGWDGIGCNLTNGEAFLLMDGQNLVNRETFLLIKEDNNRTNEAFWGIAG